RRVSGGLAEVQDAPGQMAVAARFDPVAETLDHSSDITVGDDLAQLVTATLELLPDAGVMPYQMGRQVRHADLLPTEPARLPPIETRRPERIEVNPIEHRLQDAGRAIVRLHRIREDELAAGLQHAIDLGEHPPAVPGVKQRILRPSVVELPGVERNRLEARVVHADQ